MVSSKTLLLIGVQDGQRECSIIDSWKITMIYHF